MLTSDGLIEALVRTTVLSGADLGPLVRAVDAEARADERRRIEMAGVIDREVVLDDLRAKVKALPRVTDDYYREAVLLADVLALFDGEPNAE